MELLYMKKALSLEQYRKMYTGSLIFKRKLYIENYFDKKMLFFTRRFLLCILDFSFFSYDRPEQLSENK